MPRVINVDKNPAYPAAVEALKAKGYLPHRVRLRQCKYLNNVVEQDHRAVKKRNCGSSSNSPDVVRELVKPASPIALHARRPGEILNPLRRASAVAPGSEIIVSGLGDLRRIVAEIVTDPGKDAAPDALRLAAIHKLSIAGPVVVRRQG